jgi:Tripartite tricarboxylate transporter TctB family
VRYHPRVTTDRVAGSALALLALVVVEECWRGRLPFGTLATPGPAYVPILLAVVPFASGILIVALGRGAMGVGAAGWSEWRHTLAIVGTCAFVALAIDVLGYRITMVLACAFLIGVVERRHPVTAALVAIGLATGTYYLFDTLLRVQLPRGPFGI